MKVSKRTREQAALICAIAASGGVWASGIDGPYRTTVSGAIGVEIGADHEALVLAYAALDYCFDAITDDFDHESTLCGEAESLLRTGWTP